MESSQHLCPVSTAKYLNMGVRKLFQNPKRMFKKFIKPGDKVADLGCGPGYFSKQLSDMVGDDGVVYAVDIQEGMLDLAKQYIGPKSNIIYHKSSLGSLNLDEKFDFILSFYMVHETGDVENFLNNVSKILKPGGRYYIAEPKFHVTTDLYNQLKDIASTFGFKVVSEKSGIISRILILTI